MGTGTRGSPCWLAKAGAELLADADLIVPVPLYPARLWWRRFNQSAMLALALGRLTGPSRRLLRAQAGAAHDKPGRVTADQRRRNVAGAFKVDKTHGARV